MTNFEKELAIKHLINEGVNFEKDVFELSSSKNAIIEKAAKNFRFKPKPNNSCLSAILHARFYLYLQKYYLKNKEMFNN